MLVLARVTSAFVFVPLPAAGSGADIARAVMSLSMTLALFPKWPHVSLAEPFIGPLVLALLSEVALGLAIGVAVAVLSEAFLMAGQIIGLQAGYGYASMIDPATQADSAILVVLAQLTAALLFLALGLDREVIRAFVRSLDAFPAGSFVLSAKTANQIVRLASGIFSTGLRLAMPVLALLTLVDLALALLGRLNQQLQLLMLAFPLKMMAAISLLAAIGVLFPHVYRGMAGEIFGRVAEAAGY